MTQAKTTPAFLINSTYVVDPVDTPAFKALAIRMAEGAHSRAGCSFLNATQDLADPDTFHLSEGWESQEIFNEHLNSDEFQSILKATLALRIVDRFGMIYFVSGMQNLNMPS